MHFQKRTRFLIALLAMIGFIGTSLSTELRDQFDWNRPGSAMAADSTPYTAFLPSVSSTYPFQTIFGVEMNRIVNNQGLVQMAEAGTSWVRLNGVLWAEVEPKKSGERDWSVLSSLETQLKNAANRGMKVILIVRKTPEWAQKLEGTYCGPIAEEDLPAFGDFMKELVTRYSRHPYNVKYWELWNEPDVDPALANYIGGADNAFGCWGEMTDQYYGGGYYGEMLKAVYPKIKEADPQAQVVIGGLLLSCDPATKCSPTDTSPGFLEGILANGGGDYFDGVGFHNYEYYFYNINDPMANIGHYGNLNWSSTWNTTGPAGIAKARYVKSLLTKYAVSGKFIMNTETALVCGNFNGDGDGCVSDPDSPFEITKAYYLAQSYAAAMAENLVANVWYSTMGWRNSGLINSDLSPRPAYTALQFARQKLKNATFEGEIQSVDVGGATHIKGYKFRLSDRRVWFLWSLDGEPHIAPITEYPQAMWNVFGGPLPASSSMEQTVTIMPVYMEFSP